MRAGTLFSGIGCAELAAPEIDWRWCAERDPQCRVGPGFAAAVHAARLGTRNLEDVKHAPWEEIARDEPIDVLVFGSPCQSFSIAGRRRGLADPRGDLALIALRVAAILRPRWLVFENVPGLLSLDRGTAFGIFLGALGECGYGWAYRRLDARYFGVPQRRDRLFLVGHLGDWRPAAAVLFEPASLRRDPAPGREARPGIAGETEAAARGGGERIAGTIPAGGAVDRGLTGQDLRAGLYAEVAPTLEATAGRSRGAGTPLGMLAPPVIASDGKRGKSRHEGAALVEVWGETAHTLRAEGADASEDGTGRGTPIVEAWGGNNTSGPIDVATAVRAHPGPNGHQDFESETFIAVADPITAREGDSYTHEGRGNFRLRNVVAFDPTQITHPENRSRADGDTAALAARARPPTIGFTVKDHGADAGADVAPTLRAMEHAGGNANAGGQIGVSTGARLRRLTPRECERLMGVPDDYTAITYRGRPAKDGPRYRALGNGMAVPVMRWILTRLRRQHGEPT